MRENKNKIKKFNGTMYFKSERGKFKYKIEYLMWTIQWNELIANWVDNQYDPIRTVTLLKKTVWMQVTVFS